MFTEYKMMMKLNFLPPLDIPMTPSPHLSSIKQHTQSLMNKYELKFANELCVLTVLVYPHLNSRHLNLANDIHIFLWVLDDFVDNGQVELDSKLQALHACRNVITRYNMNTPIDKMYIQKGKQEAEDSDLGAIKEIPLQENDLVNTSSTSSSYCSLPYAIRIAYVLNDILSQFITEKRHALLQYMLVQILDYFQGVEQHLALKKHTILSVDAYETIRLRDGACEVVWPLCFLDRDDFDSIALFLNCQQGCVVRRCATRNVSYVNDLLSYPRDVLHGEQFNIICSYMNDHQVEYTIAHEVVTTWCNEYYVQLEQLIDRSNDAQHNIQNDVISKLLHWCVASAYWHHIAKRYHHSTPLDT